MSGNVLIDSYLVIFGSETDPISLLNTHLVVHVGAVLFKKA